MASNDHSCRSLPREDAGLKAPASAPTPSALAPTYGETSQAEQLSGAVSESAACLPPMGRPRVLPSLTVLLSVGSSVLPPDPPDSVPRWDFTSSRLYRPPCASRVLRAGTEPFPALHDVLYDRAATHTPQGLPVLVPVASRKVPAFASMHQARPLHSSAPTSAEHGISARQCSLYATARPFVSLPDGSHP